MAKVIAGTAACAIAALTLLGIWNIGSDISPAEREAARKAATVTLGFAAPPPVVACHQRREAAPSWPPRGWRRDAVVAGPIAFVGMRSFADERAAEFADLATRARADLAAGRGTTSRRGRRALRHSIATGKGVFVPRELFVLERAERQVTVVVPRPQELWAEGEPRRSRAITFQACPSWERRFSGHGRLGKTTHFGAGIVVHGAGCVPFDFWIDGAKAPIRRWVSFGTRGRGCRRP
jgi:hypothetical protein